MKKRTLWSFAISTMIIVALTACSGNPVDDKGEGDVTKTITTSAKKTVKKVTKIVGNTVTKKTAPKKMRVVVNKAKSTATVKKTSTVKKPIVVAKAKQRSRAKSRAKVQATAVLAKSKQIQAKTKSTANQSRPKSKQVRIKYKQANKRYKQVKKRKNILRARHTNKEIKGRLGITGNRADRLVVRKAVAKRAPSVVSRARSATPTKIRTRAKQAITVKSRQLIKTRSPQPVAVRAKQPIRTRSKQPVRVRSKQPVRIRSKQPVLPRVTKYIAHRKAPTRVAARLSQQKRNARKVSVSRRSVVNRVRKNIRKVAYKRPVKRRISRIDPNVSFGYALSNAAIERTKHRVRYDGKYVKIGYPWGDIPKSIGVCTDVVIRAYRRLGIDLQQEVHKDMSQDFYAYPNLVKWGLSKPDSNIDHRRVYNLQAFFKRHKAELPRSKNPRHYKPGDLVTWMVRPNFPHIGVVVNKPSKADPNRLMIAHNIGYGPKVEDILFRFPMTGHYRYTPRNKKINPAVLFAKTPAPPSISRRQLNNGMTNAEMLQASKILSGKVRARSLRNSSSLLADSKKAKLQRQIMLAQLNASIRDSAGINRDALKALLK